MGLVSFMVYGPSGFVRVPHIQFNSIGLATVFRIKGLSSGFQHFNVVMVLNLLTFMRN